MENDNAEFWAELQAKGLYTVLVTQPVNSPDTMTENAERHTFKAPCCCFENAPYIELTIVCTINVSIDCQKNEVSNLLVEKIYSIVIQHKV